MKRWSVLLLLVLLPLTMAPRTSLTPGESALAVNVVVARTAVEAGTPIRVQVQARNTTRSVLERAAVQVLIAWDGKSDALTISDLPDDCVLTVNENDRAIQELDCLLGQLRAGQQGHVRFQVEPSGPGTLVLSAAGIDIALQPQFSQTIVVGGGAP